MRRDYVSTSSLSIFSTLSFTLVIHSRLFSTVCSFWFYSLFSSFLCFQSSSLSLHKCLMRRVNLQKNHRRTVSCECLDCGFEGLWTREIFTPSSFFAGPSDLILVPKPFPYIDIGNKGKRHIYVKSRFWSKVLLKVGLLKICCLPFMSVPLWCLTMQSWYAAH